jgi:hypothetical protein
MVGPRSHRRSNGVGRRIDTGIQERLGDRGERRPGRRCPVERPGDQRTPVLAEALTIPGFFGGCHAGSDLVGQRRRARPKHRPHPAE